MITADNIITMRSDLKLVSNNVDVISFVIKVIEKKVFSLDAEVTKKGSSRLHIK